MNIQRSGTQASAKGPAEYFTGAVRIEKHWHGATATMTMTHVAIVEQLDGKAVDWMEKVTDEQYQAGSSAD